MSIFQQSTKRMTLCLSALSIAGFLWADPVLKGEYYQITNLSDLEWFRDQVNNGNGGIKAELKANITINENVLGTLKILSDGMNSNGEGLKRWTPIGKTDKLPFSGEFKGNNYTISGVYISAENSASTNVGLFGTNKGVIHDLNVADSYILGMKNMGGIAGNNMNTINKCSYEGYVVATMSNAGGIAGYASGANVRYCFSKGTVISMDRQSGNAGGIIGQASGMSVETMVTGCYSISNIVSGSKNAGGVIGYQNGQVAVENCYSKKAYNNSPETVKSDEEFKNGTVAGLLGDAYGLTLGKDDSPVFRKADFSNMMYKAIVYKGSRETMVVYMNPDGSNRGGEKGEAIPIGKQSGENNYIAVIDETNPAFNDRVLGNNVIRNNNGKYTAKCIFIMDGKDYFMPYETTTSLLLFYRVFKPGTVNTVTLPFFIDKAQLPDGCKIYEYQNFAGNTLYFAPCANPVPNKPYMFVSSVNQPFMRLKQIKMAATRDAVDLKGMGVFNGNYTSIVSHQNMYVYQADKFMRVEDQQAVKILPFRGYFDLNIGSEIKTVDVKFAE